MKLKAVLPWGVTALVLLACLMLPLLFTGREPEPAPSTERELTSARRAEIYSLFAADELGFTHLDEDEVGNEDYVKCVRLANTVRGILVMDEGETRVDNPFGTNFYTLSDDGDTIRIMEYYYEWTADWHNWLTMHIDIDTGEIYYLYYSANVLQNGWDYAGRAEDHLAAAGERLVTALGLELVSAEYESGELWKLELGWDGEERVYDVICGIYEDAAPSLLIDLRITITGVSGA